MSVTCRPRASSKAPIEDAASPLPKLETTPPVTKMYLGIVLLSVRTPPACSVTAYNPRASGPHRRARRRRAYRLPLPADHRPLRDRRTIRAVDPVGRWLPFFPRDRESAVSPLSRPPSSRHSLSGVFEIPPRSSRH